MSDIASTQTSEHYIWGGDCDGWHLLRRDDLSIIEERVPGGRSEARHRHSLARQFFYVLEGEAELEVDGRAHRLRRNDGIEVPPGVAHRFRNVSSEDVLFLVISAPKSHGDRQAC